MTNLHAFGDNLIVKPNIPDTIGKSALYMTEETMRQLHSSSNPSGTIISKGKKVAEELEEGMTVVFKNTFTTSSLDEASGLLVIPEHAVLAYKA